MPLLTASGDSTDNHEMNPYLRRKIDETRVRLEAAQQEIATLKGELRAYEDALAHELDDAKLANGAVAPATKARPAPPVGYWSSLIETLDHRANQFTIDDVMQELAHLGKKIERKSVRSKLTDLVKEGVVIRITDGVFRAAPQTRP